MLRFNNARRNINGKISYKYNLGFTSLDFTTIQTLRRSIYGFFIVFFFNDLTTKILPVPLLWDESPQNNNISASYSVKMTNFVRTEKQLVPFGGLGTIPWILDTGYWDNEAYWINSKYWIS